jgi:hypothetical protein
MKTHPVNVQVILPTTTASIIDLLAAMATCLSEDAERYMKTYKTPVTHPAVQDKTFAADVILDAIKTIREASKERWEKHNAR